MIQNEFDFPIVDPPELIPPGAKFLYQENCYNVIRRIYFVSQSESDKCVTKRLLEIRHLPADKTYRMKAEILTFPITERHQKFLCVNGPLAGERVTEEQAKPHGYIRFNNADNAYRAKGWPRGVLVCNIFLTPTGMVKMA